MHHFYINISLNAWVWKYLFHWQLLNRSIRFSVWVFPFEKTVFILKIAVARNNKKKNWILIYCLDLNLDCRKRIYILKLKVWLFFFYLVWCNLNLKRIRTFKKLVVQNNNLPKYHFTFYLNKFVQMRINWNLCNVV